MANKNLFPTETTAIKPSKKSEKPAKGKRQPKPAVEPVEVPAESVPETARPTPAKKVKTAGANKPKKSSMMAAALEVLASAKEPMSCVDLIETMAIKGLWTSPGGKTPANTLYSSFLRMIQAKGKASAIRKVDKGTFEINTSATA